MPTSFDLQLSDGRRLRVHDAGPDAVRDGLTLVWHHGTPQTGALLPPLLAAAERRGIRLVSYARPAYPGSSPAAGRTIASAADDVRQIADALSIDRFVTMGASGGGPHALACAALLPDRVAAAVTLAGMAPYTTEFDWLGGMASPGALRAALEGREERARFAETAEFDPNSFIEADWEALGSDWASLGQDAMAGGEAGPDGEIDDDVAYATAWGFDPGAIAAPVLLVQGGADRVVPAAHAEWLVRHLPAAELWLRPRDGHVSVLHAVPVAMDWLRDRVGAQ